MDQAAPPAKIPLTGYAPVMSLEGDLTPGLLIIVDHAMADLPKEYGSLGLAPDQLERHIAYDIGIKGVAEHIHSQLNVPVMMATFSRLLIDPNRGSDDPTLVMRISDGALIPSNAYVEKDEIERRKQLFHQPYHDALSAKIDEFLQEGICPVLLSLHSFTHDWRGVTRPWHAGLLWDQDPRFVEPLLKGLRAEEGLVVGDNQPYTGKLKGDCMHSHGTTQGLAHALVEIRQDLITAPDGQAEWGARLARILAGILGDEAAMASCREKRFFGSYSDNQ